MNIAQSLKLHARLRPRKIAIEFSGKQLDYDALWNCVAAAVVELNRAGVKAGDRVGLCMRDHPTHLIYHYAVAALAAVIVPVDHRWSGAECKDVSKAFNLVLLVIDKGADRDVSVRTMEVNAWPSDKADGLALALPDCGTKDLLISLSSGTTGKPKGALVTHRQMYERFITQWVTLGFNATDRFALVTPMYFGAGRSFGMAFLAAGATVVIEPPPHKGTQLADAINTSRATSTFLVPTVMRRMLDQSTDGVLFPHLRRLLISGEAFFANEIDDFKAALTPNLIGYYASSEGGGISVLQPHDFDQHGASVGQAAFGVDVSVVDEDNKEVAHDEPGRLRYRGPGVARQTLNESGKKNPPDPDGWFYPGDLASLGADGFVTLRGRASDTINRAGVNVYPAEIEAVLVAHEAIREAVVMGVADASHGERIAAFIVSPQAQVPSDLEAFIARRLAPYKRPAEYHVLAEMPKAASGKIDKKVLQQRLRTAT